MSGAFTHWYAGAPVVHLRATGDFAYWRAGSPVVQLVSPTAQALTAELGAGGYASSGFASLATHLWLAAAAGGSYSALGLPVAPTTRREASAAGGEYAYTGWGMESLRTYGLAAQGGTYLLDGRVAFSRAALHSDVLSLPYILAGWDATASRASWGSAPVWKVTARRILVLKARPIRTLVT